MEQLNNLDVVLLIIIGISALVGIARGMTKEILSICGWGLAAVSTFYLTPLVNPITKNYIASDILSNLVSGLAVLIVFCIVWIIIEDKISALIRQSKLSTLDRLFGFIFGAARGGLLVVLVALMISTLVPESMKIGALSESKIFKEASLYVEPVKSMIPQSWIDSIKEKTESLGLSKSEDKATAEDKDNKDAVDTSDKTGEDSQSAAVQETETEGKPAEKSKTEEKKTEGEDNALEENLEVLQKTGEELFKKLAQPKPAGNVEDEQPEESDLDKLLDVLEDKLVSSDEDMEALTNISQKVTDTVVDTLAESVADKVVDRVAAKAAAKAEVGK